MLAQLKFWSKKNCYLPYTEDVSFYLQDNNNSES